MASFTIVPVADVSTEMTHTPSGPGFSCIDDNADVSDFISNNQTSVKTDINSFSSSPADVQTVTSIFIYGYGYKSVTGSLAISYSINGGTTWSTSLTAFTTTAGLQVIAFGKLSLTKAQIDGILTRTQASEASSRDGGILYSLKIDGTYTPAVTARRRVIVVGPV